MVDQSLACGTCGLWCSTERQEVAGSTKKRIVNDPVALLFACWVAPHGFISKCDAARVASKGMEVATGCAMCTREYEGGGLGTPGIPLFPRDCCFP